jgi:hypothetical protein
LEEQKYHHSFRGILVSLFSGGQTRNFFPRLSCAFHSQALASRYQTVESPLQQVLSAPGTTAPLSPTPESRDIQQQAREARYAPPTRSGSQRRCSSRCPCRRRPLRRRRPRRPASPPSRSKRYEPPPRLLRRALIKSAGRLSSFRQETDEYFSSSLGWLLRLPCLLLGLLGRAPPTHPSRPCSPWRRRF